MAKANRNALIGTLVILVVVSAAGLGHQFLPRLTPPTPPLLKGATAAGGWWSGGCPPQHAFKHLSDEAKSPEIEERLRKQFPAGTSAAALEQLLASQGFAQTENCPNDASIRRATFNQQGRGFLPYPAFAVVAWKADAQDKIVWTKAMIHYDGL